MPAEDSLVATFSPLRISYRNRRSEYEELAAAYESPSAKGRRFLIFVIGLLLLISILALPQFQNASGLPRLAVAAFGGFLIWWSLQLSPRRHARKIWKNADDEEIKAEITESGIHFERARVDQSFDWEAFTDLMESRSSFALGEGHIWYMIPKRAFTSTDLDRFRSLLERKINNRKNSFGITKAQE